MKTPNTFFLALIIVLAAALRFWNLPSNPPGLTWDETAIGYNAYSLSKTGRDEYGTFLPFNLKSFGDYKPALYVYLDIPFVALFGLNELAVRLPSAIVGILSVLILFYLIDLLFKNKSLALLGAFFLAISPWAIQYSRPAYEANLALFLTLLGVYFLIKGFKNTKWFLFSSIIFGLSLFCYQGSRLFVPLIVLLTIFIFRGNFKRNKNSIISAILLVIFFLILTGTTFLGGQTQRLSTLNVFAYRRSADEINLISKEDGLDKSGLLFQTLHGEWWSYARGLVERYVIYFSPDILFVKGNYSERDRVPDLGILYYFSAILIPLGLFKLIKQKTKEANFILLWLLIAPIPAILSRDLITTLRALNMVIPLAIAEGFGLLVIFNFLQGFKNVFKILGIAFVSLVIFLNLLIFLDRYFIHAPIEYSKFWLYGYKQMFQQLGDLNKYNKVVITDTSGQPYIYYLFYNKYSPEKFQKQAILDQPTIDVGTVRKIDNIEFRPIYWPKDRGDRNSVFVGTIFELPDQDVKPFPEYHIINDVNLLNGEHLFRVVKTD